MSSEDINGPAGPALVTSIVESVVSCLASGAHRPSEKREDRTELTPSSVPRYDQLRLVSQLAGRVAQSDRNKSSLQSLQCQLSQSLHFTKEKCQ